MFSSMSNNWTQKERSILKAGSKIFSEKNFHEVKMQEVANEAGVGKGTIYEYFSSKEELLSEIIKMSVDHYQAVINFENIEGKGLWNRLENYLLANVNFFWDNKEIGRLILRFEHPFKTEISEWFLNMREGSLRDLETVFKEAKDNQEIKNISPDIAAKMVRGIIIEIISATIIVEREEVTREEIKEALEVIKDGLLER